MPAAPSAAPSSPGLFGLRDTNRDFTNPRFWGKNQFNSSFPAALACYFGYQGLQPVYLTLDSNLAVVDEAIEVIDLLGLRPLAPDGSFDFANTPDLHFNFESVYIPHAPFAIGQVPRVDLVTQNARDRTHLLRALEVKLTALPDNMTYALNEDKYGCELVVRPDTIVYLALNVAAIYQTERAALLRLLEPVCTAVSDWQAAAQIYPLLPALCAALDSVLQPK
ncbi:MAG: HindVP family restriction endonuclease, partial [Chloroflexota bacterium]|nr:HindVP family restriction endonuclease [Chloroflexota bacterium]